MANQDLAGRVYVVTGAASGIGERVALALAARGAHLALLDKDHDSGANLYRTIRSEHPKCNAVLKICGVEDAAAVDSFATSVSKSFPRRLSGIINCAGINPKSEKLHETTLEQYKAIMDTNVQGTYNVCRAFVKVLVQQGPSAAPDGGYAIVNMGSTASLLGIEDSSIYCASKHAVVGLSKAMAREYANIPIRVNVVAPGPIDTPLLQTLFDGSGDTSQIPLRRTGAFIIVPRLIALPIGNAGSPEEVAGVILFLLSSAAAYITGTVIPIDGGWTSGSG